MDNRSIGVFDSGVGGLTVVKQILKALPNEEVIYFGDTLRVPYGSKTLEQLDRYSAQNLKFLLDKDVKAVIIACNTVSSNCYERLCSLTDKPVLEIITPGVEAAGRTAKKRIGLIATEATVNSKAHKRKLANINAGLELFEKACPLFVPIIEERLSETKIAYETAEYYLKDLVKEQIDTLILGCTHYPLMTEALAKALPAEVKLVDPAISITSKLEQMLKDNDICRKAYSEPEHKFFVSGEERRFDVQLHSIIGKQFYSKKVIMP